MILLIGIDWVADIALDRMNTNQIDTEKPMITSGIRLGTPAGTTRGFGTSEFSNIGNWIADVLDQLQINGIANNEKVELEIKNKVLKLCANFPI